MRRVWTSHDFEGHYPVGTAAVVVADDEDTARALLGAHLIVRGLPGDGFTLEPLPLDGTVLVRVLCDGDY